MSEERGIDSKHEFVAKVPNEDEGEDELLSDAEADQIEFDTDATNQDTEGYGGEDCRTSLQKSTQENLAAILARRRTRMDAQKEQSTGDSPSSTSNTLHVPAEHGEGVEKDDSANSRPEKITPPSQHSSPLKVTPITEEWRMSPQSRSGPIDAAEMARRAQVTKGMVFSKESLHQYAEARIKQSKENSPRSLSADVAFLSDIRSPGYKENKDNPDTDIRSRAGLPGPKLACGKESETSELNAVLQPVMHQYQAIVAKALLGATLRLLSPWHDDGRSFPVYVRASEDCRRILWSSLEGYNGDEGTTIFGEIFIETIDEVVCGQEDLSIKVLMKEPPGVAQQHSNNSNQEEKTLLTWPRAPRMRGVKPLVLIPADSLQRRDWVLILAVTHGIWTLQDEGE